MKVRLTRRISELRLQLGALRKPGVSIACVPTMGALHAGHGRLIERARADCDVVVVTIFVNPIQFNQTADFEHYPRLLETDLIFCDERRADFVFAPDENEMYPERPLTHVDVERLSDHLCGSRRPGHFRGVATVVTKLLNIVQPAKAYFGEKDAQQLAIVRRLVRDLDIPVEIVPVETVREADGLAISSRNKRLNEEERGAAPVLYRSLRAAARTVADGGRETADVVAAARAVLNEEPRVEVEYLEVVDAAEMQPVERVGGAVRIAVAAWLGDTRLIDNVLADPATSPR